MVRVFTNPVSADPRVEPWPFVSTTPEEWRHARRYVDAGVVEALLIDTGAYRLYFRRGVGIPRGFLDYYAGKAREIALYAVKRGVAEVYYVVPDSPYNPQATVELHRRWFREGYHRALEGLAEPVGVVQGPRGDPDGLVESFKSAPGVYGRFRIVAAPPVDRGGWRSALLAARAWAALAVALRPGQRLHMLGLTLQAAGLLEREARITGGCGRLAGGDTSSWYWDKHYRRRRTPLIAYMKRLTERVERAARACAAPSITSWLAPTGSPA